METFKALTTRKSVRDFDETKDISKKDIERIVNTARFAPTARNEQPWEFIVITLKDTREKIADIANYGKFIATAPICIAVYCRDTKYYLEDGCSATENILIAATALGIGSCWVAGDKKEYAKNISQILGVPEQYKLVSLIALGYPTNDIALKDKRTLEDVMHWERLGK